MDFKDCFLAELDLQISEKHLLKHVFYQAWNRGELSKECLREYAKEYYHHVKAFPTYLSALHAHTEDMETRKEILQNLMEEEAGTPNHPDMWRGFALSLGATQDEIASHTPCKEIQELIKNFKSICTYGTVTEGLASLYAYESQIPAICVSKIDGLRKHYGMTEPEEWRYFSVHIAADVEHAEAERKLIGKHITQHEVGQVKTSTQVILDSLWNFLDGLCERYQIACGCAV